MPELVVKLKGRVLRRVPITSVITRIGRDRVNEVCIDNIGVSRLHCTIKAEGDGFVAYDEESSNGLFVNGQEVLARQLHDGDVIQLGKYTLTWDPHAGAPAGELAPNLVTDDVRLQKARMRNPMETAHLSVGEMEQLLRERLREAEAEDPTPAQRNDEGPRRDPSLVATAPHRRLAPPPPRREGRAVMILGATVILLVGVIAVLLMTR